MSPILILTKNLLVEQTLQEQLQYLSYEIFCSVELLNRLKVSDHYDEGKNNDLKLLFKNFQAIILSETISDNDIQVLIPLIQADNRVLFRKLNSKPSKKEEEQITKMGIDGWIIADHSIDYLREQMAEKLSVNQREEQNIVFLYPNQRESENFVWLKNSLSNKERSVFDCLILAEGAVVTREELCTCLWNDVPNNSHLSQISVLIKRIKLKLEQAGYDPEILKTVWGSGYLLSTKSITHEYLEKVR
ncbi:winged helix-turn-helix domain-containing protein [Enterococcus sp. DIV0170]|uniref:winged helix-turn-helix domain-containing protein n=1 Tax=Enterococcus sp. DIV0170 TaxID=2774642 RepID=UPI003F2621D5